jgi:hypothetical protein
MPQNSSLNIACLGWGSLIWDRRTLPIRGKWFDDGPLLPVEFSRESSDGRITLVICDVDYDVRTYWALLDARDLNTAKSDLAKREGIEAENIDQSIGYWDKGSNKSHGRAKTKIAAWAQTMNIDAVVWTNLETGFKSSRGTLPSSDDVLRHLRNLPDAKRRVAEEYIRKVPAQIDTDYRRLIECELSSGKLNRFTSLNELLDLLRRGKLRLGDPAYWEDENDIAAIEAYRKEEGIEKLFAKCFLHQSETMFHWKTYADGTSGCCIEFDKQELLDSIKKAPENESRKVVCCSVKYKRIEYVEENIDDIETGKLPFTKRLPYEPEAEYRIFGQGKMDETTIDLEISLSSIRKITLSQLMPKDKYVSTEILLRRIIKSRGMDMKKITINRSTIYCNPRWIAAFARRADAMCSHWQHI